MTRTNPTVPKLSQNDRLSQNSRHASSRNHWDSDHSRRAEQKAAYGKIDEKQVRDTRELCG